VVVLAVGTLLKGFPVLLLPALVISARRAMGVWRIDLPILFGLTVIVGSTPFLLVGAQHFWSPLTYALQRPLHIESLPGLLVLFSNQGATSPVFSFGSCNIIGPNQTTVSILFSCLFVVGVIQAYRRLWLGLDSPARSLILILMVAVVTNKVFSPQYLLWLLPAVAYNEGFNAYWLVIAVLTSYSFDSGVLCNHSVLALPGLGVPFLNGGQMDAATKLLARDLALGLLTVYYLACRGDRATGYKNAT
jgi:hypothetical protein